MPNCVEHMTSEREMEVNDQLEMERVTERERKMDVHLAKPNPPEVMN